VPLPRRARMLALIATVALAAGCSIAPKTFRKMSETAPIVRARAVGSTDGLPATQAIPTLIEHLSDPDPVVRLAASEELRRKTGQTLGFLPWGSEAERGEAVNRWRAWWSQREASARRSTTPSSNAAYQPRP
jgi:HEAT repeat protein